jgi:hypothetical protein
VVTENRLAIVSGRWRDCKLLAPLVNPDGQLYEICQRQLLDSLLDFLDLAHGVLVAFHSLAVIVQTVPHTGHSEQTRKRRFLR